MSSSHQAFTLQFLSNQEKGNHDQETGPVLEDQPILKVTTARKSLQFAQPLAMFSPHAEPLTPAQFNDQQQDHQEDENEDEDQEQGQGETDLAFRNVNRHKWIQEQNALRARKALAAKRALLRQSPMTILAPGSEVMELDREKESKSREWEPYQLVKQPPRPHLTPLPTWLQLSLPANPALYSPTCSIKPHQRHQIIFS
jgi:hypothetical protein